MKVPKHIKNRMHKIAKYTSIAAEEMKTVENWLEAKGFDVEELRSGDGYSLEELEYGNDITEVFCEKLTKLKRNYNRD